MPSIKQTILTDRQTDRQKDRQTDNMVSVQQKSQVHARIRDED